MICCDYIPLPPDTHFAAMQAIDENPANRVVGAIEPQHLALLTSKYWGAAGVKLGVSFMEMVSPELAAKIVFEMNSWFRAGANVEFTFVPNGGDVRITLKGQGYWSYLGTDIKSIPSNQPTMCLQDFTLSTADSEYHRVVRHETGHTLGFPHEHLRGELIGRLDFAKTIAYFGRTQGWSPQMVTMQVLTPLEESSLIATPHADAESIMCYQLPGVITKDGQPIIGGADLDSQDVGLASKLYPRATPPPPPPPPPESGTTLILHLDGSVHSFTSEIHNG